MNDPISPVPATLQSNNASTQIQMACQSPQISDASSSNHPQDTAPPRNLGLLGTLSPEIRWMIYGHVLGFKNPVRLVETRYLSFFTRHVCDCPVRIHRRVPKSPTLKCTSHFDASDVDTYEPPRSVLELFLVSKQVSNEALPLFFEQNSIIFETSRVGIPLQDSLCTNRFELIQNVTLLWSSAKILETVKALYRLPRLRRLALIISFWPNSRPWRLRNKPLATMKGMAELSHLRELEEVNLAGKDFIRRVDGEWNEVDINHPAAVGPWLRFMLMRPKQPGYEKDLEFHMEALGGMSTWSHIVEPADVS
ncbi:MAG: hypothetical protein Q9208_005764 [Pyrenodesmia sp. 3 TL-2023]